MGEIESWKEEEEEEENGIMNPKNIAYYPSP